MAKKISHQVTMETSFIASSTAKLPSGRQQEFAVVGNIATLDA
jgi:hypothetical protein